MAKTNDDVLRKQVIAALEGGLAHAELDTAVKSFPAKQYNACPDGVPYSFWQLLEHIRIAQWDIVEFTINSNHKSPSWPGGYWPKKKATAAAWKKTIAGIKKDRDRLVKLIADPNTDLTADIPHARGYTVLREALLVVDHSAYHLGAFILMRRAIGNWKE